MIILVCGGRDFTDRDVLFKVLDHISKSFRIDLIVHGAARGADRLAGQWAETRGIPSEPMAANWIEHGRRAGPIRNQAMLDKFKPDMVVAFPGGTGTADMIRRSRKSGVPVTSIELCNGIDDEGKFHTVCFETSYPVEELKEAQV